MKTLILSAGQGYFQHDLFHLFTTHRHGKEWLNQVEKQLGFSVVDHADKLTDIAYTQRYISYYQLGIFDLIKHFLPKNTYLAGYSLGEVTAYLYSIGATLAEADMCIGYRTSLMTELLKNQEQYDLVSIQGQFSLQEIKTVCEINNCYIAIINSANHLILGGKKMDLNQVLNHKKFSNLISKFLAIHLPSHTPLYKNQSLEFKCFLSQHFNQSTLQFPLFNSLKCAVIHDNKQEIDLLSCALSETLQWQRVNQLIQEYYFDLIIDIGPGKAMSALFLAVNPDYEREKILCVSDFKTLDGLFFQLNSFFGDEKNERN